MYKVVKSHIIKSQNNSKCKVFPSSFKFIDYINSEYFVADANKLSNTRENIMIYPLIVLLLKQKRKKNFRPKWIEF